MDGIEVVFGALGEGVGFTHQAADPGAQGAKPAFDVTDLALDFGAAAVRSRREGGGGFPEVAARGVPPVILGQAGAQIAGALLAAVTQRLGDDLAGSSAEGHPQPERLDLALPEAPEFVECEHVTLLRGQERGGEGGELLGSFPPASAGPSGSRPRKCARCLGCSSGLGRPRAPGL